MDRPPSPLQIFPIHFPNGNQAQAILASPDAQVPDLIACLHLPQPRALILITGGASKINQENREELSALAKDIVHIAASLNALLIDGGTHTGVMELIGQSAAQQTPKPTLLGITPSEPITYPGKSDKTPDGHMVSLEPNHSHFVLVQSNTWGDETEIMYAIAQVFADHIPSVAILINGGEITKNEVLQNVRQHRPIILIEGSGRAADEIATTMKTDTASPDNDLAEIMDNGKLHLFPITHSAKEFKQLIQTLLTNKSYKE